MGKQVGAYGSQRRIVGVNGLSHNFRGSGYQTQVSMPVLKHFSSLSLFAVSYTFGGRLKYLVSITYKTTFLPCSSKTTDICLKDTGLLQSTLLSRILLLTETRC